MSLLRPFLGRDASLWSMADDPYSVMPWFDFPRPSALFDQTFGDVIIDGVDSSWPKQIEGKGRRAHGLSEVILDDKQFRVNLDTRHFQPNEVTVKHVDNRLVVRGEHTEREDAHGFISRSFTRQYVLPKDIEREKLEAKLSSDGFLHISAPRIISKDDAKAREIVIPITRESARAPEKLR